MAGYTEMERAAGYADRTENLRSWSESITVDEKGLRNIIVNIFEAPGDCPPIAYDNFIRALEGVRNQIDAYRDSTIMAYGTLESVEIEAIGRHMEIEGDLEVAFNKARMKDDGFLSAISRVGSQIVAIGADAASWTIALPGQAIDKATGAVNSAILSTGMAAGNVISAGQEFVDSAGNAASKAATGMAWILGGVVVVLIVGMVALGRVNNIAAGGK